MLRRDLEGQERYFALFGAAAFLIAVFGLKFTRTAVLVENAYSLKAGAEQAVAFRMVLAFRAPSPFNVLDLGLFNPSDEDIVCDYALRQYSDGRLLGRGTIVLVRNTNMANRSEVVLPKLGWGGGRMLRLEVSTRGNPFYVLRSTAPYAQAEFQTRIGPNLVSGSFVFSASRRERMSLFGFLSGSAASGRSRFVVTVLLSVAALLLGALNVLAFRRRAAGPAPFPFPAAILLCLAASLFLLAGASFIVGNNVHSKFYGAEDDAFITYRYAANLAQGRGFVFNPGERVLGTTTPLYTLILAFIGLFWSNLPAASFLLNVGSILLSAWLVYLLLAEKTSSSMAVWGAAAFLYFPFFYRVLGMETNLVILLIMAGFYAFARGRPALAFAASGLAVLTRMECVLAAAVLGLALLRRRDFRALIRGAASFLAVVLPWFVFSAAYFGRLLPNTFYAKTLGGHPEGFFSQIPQALADLFTLKFGRVFFLSGFGAYLRDNIQDYAAWVVLFGLFFLVGLFRSFRHWLLRAHFLWVVLYVAAYAVIRPPRFIWYYVLPLAAVPLFMAAGIDRLGELARPKVGPRLSTGLTACLAAGLCFFSLKNNYDFFFSRWLSKGSAFLERYDAYRDIAAYVRTNIPADKSIAMEEIGIVGYGIPNRVWDLFMLIHLPKPGSYTARLPDIPERIPVLIEGMDPDYVLLNFYRYVSHPSYRNYEIVAEFPVLRFPAHPFISYVLLRRRP